MANAEKYAEQIIGERAAEFTGLEIRGVVDRSGEVEITDTPEFFTVYVQHTNTEWSAVGDFDDRPAAVAYANELAVKYGWLQIS